MKEHPIDLAVREERHLQEAAAETKKSRVISMAMLTAAALILLGLGTAIWLKPQKTISAEENRALQTFPRFTVERFLSGAFTADVATFYADQFPLRSGFVGLKAMSEAALLKAENNGVMIGRGGYLIDRLEYGAREYGSLDANLASVRSLAELAEREGTPFVFAVAPRTVDVMESAYPALYRNTRVAVARERIRKGFPTAIDLSVPLREKAAAGETVMLCTDHHWTSLGAYYAYVALGDALGYEPLPREAFTEDTVSERFFGTTYSASGIKWAEPDTVTLFRGADDGSYTVTVAESGEVTRGFYDESALSEKDKYKVFLGGNFGRVSIRKEGDPDRPTLLCVKDSFALSLVPFLARHFDIEMIDPRYYDGSASDFLTGEDPALPEPDAVLVLLGVDSLAQSEILRRVVRYK